MHMIPLLKMLFNLKERIKRFYIKIYYLFKNHKVNNKASSPKEDRGKNYNK